MKLHIVSTLTGGYAREDSAAASVVGAYTNPAVADAVRKVSGYGASVSAIEVDHIPPGLLEAIKQFGIKLPENN